MIRRQDSITNLPKNYDVTIWPLRQFHKGPKPWYKSLSRAVQKTKG
jgi:hypothetical protein